MVLALTVIGGIVVVNALLGVAFMAF